MRIFLADLAHREADMNEHPVSRLGHIVLQQPEINFATHSNDIDERSLSLV